MSVKLTDEPTDTSYNMFERNFGLLFSDNDKVRNRRTHRLYACIFFCSLRET